MWFLCFFPHDTPSPTNIVDATYLSLISNYSCKSKSTNGAGVSVQIRRWSDTNPSTLRNPNYGFLQSGFCFQFNQHLVKLVDAFIKNCVYLMSVQVKRWLQSFFWVEQTGQVYMSCCLWLKTVLSRPHWSLKSFVSIRRWAQDMFCIALLDSSNSILVGWIDVSSVLAQ